MNQTKIKAEIVGHSLSPQGDELISVLCTFPRIILSEMNTHRMLSKNTSSSRAIPFNKMVESVQNDPFIPIAWQKEHKGMQGSEYITEDVFINEAKSNWLAARDNAIESASYLNKTCQVTKQLCNRLLEPFMWTTMLITGSKEGWDNFFSLRCPSYTIANLIDGDDIVFKSKKDFLKELDYEPIYPDSDLDWLKLNKGQAEIHMMALAEAIYDAVNESTPKQLKAGEWHISFGDDFDIDKVAELYYEIINNDRPYPHISSIEETKIKISTARCARLSYMTFDGEIDYEKDLKLHNTLLESQHMSPMEHCARAMSDYEYDTFVKGKITDRRGVYDFQNPYDYSREESIKNRKNVGGWCNNLKGFIPYRYMIDNKTNIE